MQFIRCLIDLIPNGSKFNETDDKLVVDGANGVGGEKLEILKKMLSGLAIEVHNSGKEGVLNEGVGADYVQKEKVVPQGFGAKDVGIRLVISAQFRIFNLLVNNATEDFQFSAVAFITAYQLCICLLDK